MSRNMLDYQSIRRLWHRENGCSGNLISGEIVSVERNAYTFWGSNDLHCRNTCLSYNSRAHRLADKVNSSCSKNSEAVKLSM